jgi:hypothetical protein
MAVPDLVFPDLQDDPIDRIWEAVKAILRADKNLKSVRTLRLWEGNPDDAQPPAAGQMPWVRVTPTASPMTWGDEASFRVDLTFKYELAVQGTKMRNLFRLFGAFRKALNLNAPIQDTEMLAFLQSSGAVVHEFRTAAIGPLKVRDVEPDPMTGTYPVQNLASTGVFVIRAYIPAIS